VFDTGADATATITGTSLFELDIEINVRTIGATGTVESSGKYSYQAAALGGAVESRVPPAQTTVDTTIGALLDVTGKWGTADPANSLTIDQASVEILA
jgi:hypothetical protein